MRLVVDTNVLLVSIGKKSPFRWLFDAILNGSITLLVTDDILREYQEIITQQTDNIVAENVVKTIVKLPKTEIITVYYHWKLIVQDPDDDKFADCAFCGSADYIITHDAHFKVLKTIEFPSISVLNLLELQQIFLQNI